MQIWHLSKPRFTLNRVFTETAARCRSVCMARRSIVSSIEKEISFMDRSDCFLSCFSLLSCGRMSSGQKKTNLENDMAYFIEIWIKEISKKKTSNKLSLFLFVMNMVPPMSEERSFFCTFVHGFYWKTDKKQFVSTLDTHTHTHTHNWVNLHIQSTQLTKTKHRWRMIRPWSNQIA